MERASSACGEATGPFKSLRRKRKSANLRVLLQLDLPLLRELANLAKAEIQVRQLEAQFDGPGQVAMVSMAGRQLIEQILACGLLAVRRQDLQCLLEILAGPISSSCGS